MERIREVIVVEGRYDKNTLSQVVEATVVTLGGFAVFNDKEKLAFLRRLAEKLGDDIEAAIRQLAERRRNKE